MPDVVGATQATAEANIVAAHLTVGTVTTDYTPAVPAGNVISQSPSGGSIVASETAVDLVVSIGSEPPENVVLPANGGALVSFTSEYGQGWVASDLTNGVTNEDGWATTANPSGSQEFVYTFLNGDDKLLHEATIHGGTAEGQYYSKDIQVWISADGANYSLAASGSLANSSNASINLNLGGALAQSVKLVVVNGHRTDYWELSEFIVLGTSVPVGDPIPNVVGSAQASAESTLTAAGFTPGSVSSDYSDSVAVGNVISQNPSAGTTAPAGSSVNLTVSLGVQMVTVPNVTGLAQATAQANITAAQLVVGTVSTASKVNPSVDQEFVFSFRDGKNATLNEAVIHGGAAEGQYWSKDVEVWTSTDGANYTLAASGTLPQSNGSITLDLGGVTAKSVKLVVTSGYRTDYWEIGEFEVEGVIID